MTLSRCATSKSWSGTSISTNSSPFLTRSPIPLYTARTSPDARARMSAWKNGSTIACWRTVAWTDESSFGRITLTTGDCGSAVASVGTTGAAPVTRWPINPEMVSTVMVKAANTMTANVATIRPRCTRRFGSWVLLMDVPRIAATVRPHAFYAYRGSTG